MGVGVIWRVASLLSSSSLPKAPPTFILLLLVVGATFEPNLLPSVILPEIAAKRSTAGTVPPSSIRKRRLWRPIVFHLFPSIRIDLFCDNLARGALRSIIKNDELAEVFAIISCSVRGGAAIVRRSGPLPWASSSLFPKTALIVMSRLVH